MERNRKCEVHCGNHIRVGDRNVCVSERRWRGRSWYPPLHAVIWGRAGPTYTIRCSRPEDMTAPDGNLAGWNEGQPAG